MLAESTSNLMEMTTTPETTNPRGLFVVVLTFFFFLRRGREGRKEEGHGWGYHREKHHTWIREHVCVCVGWGGVV